MSTTLAAATVAAHSVGTLSSWRLRLVVPADPAVLDPLFVILFFAIFGRRWRRSAIENGYGPQGRMNPARQAETTLAERYAKGDIDEVEYRARLEVLRANAAPPAWSAARDAPLPARGGASPVLSRVAMRANGTAASSATQYRTASTTIRARAAVQPPVTSCSAPITGAPSAADRIPAALHERRHPGGLVVAARDGDQDREDDDEAAGVADRADHQPEPRQLGREQHADREDDPRRRRSSAWARCGGVNRVSSGTRKAPTMPAPWNSDASAPAAARPDPARRRSGSAARS